MLVAGTQTRKTDAQTYLHFSYFTKKPHLQVYTNNAEAYSKQLLRSQTSHRLYPRP